MLAVPSAAVKAQRLLDHFQGRLSRNNDSVAERPEQTRNGINDCRFQSN